MSTEPFPYLRSTTRGSPVFRRPPTRTASSSSSSFNCQKEASVTAAMSLCEASATRRSVRWLNVVREGDTVRSLSSTKTRFSIRAGMSGLPEPVGHAL